MCYGGKLALAGGKKREAGTDRPVSRSTFAASNLCSNPQGSLVCAGDSFYVELIVSYPQRFSSDDLERIVDEGMIYMCACPAQVAKEIRLLRELIAYQEACLNGPENSLDVHRCIAEAARDAHARMEACLDRVLELEGWDRTDLRMPEGLRRRRDAAIDDDLS